MPRIVVNHAVEVAAGDLPIMINERPANFFLRTIGPNPFVAAMEARSFDLLLIAASVFTADSIVSRGGTTRSDFGEGWYRQLEFVIPVRDVEFWCAQADRLAEMLEFLTGDRFAFGFVHRAHRSPRQSDLLLGHDRPPKAEQVVLFSGGLDSLTGALEALQSNEVPPILVSHCSASKTIAVQKALISDLAQRLQPGRLAWVPAYGNLIKTATPETTQRSRSFLYATLGYAAASLTGASRVSFYENGIVSVNLPISRQVIGTMATRTTHPLFLSRLAALLSAVARREITVDNPYAWMTKTDVVTRLHSLGGADLIGKSNSCSSVRLRTIEHPMCGCCSQCLDRRFAILAAGLGDDDPADRYEVDVLLGARSRDLDRTMANDWTRHAARHLRAASPLQFRGDFAAALADVAAGYPAQTPNEVLSAAYEMHRRHGTSVHAVLQRVVQEQATSIVEGQVPEHSLLAAVLLDGVPTSKQVVVALEAEEPSLTDTEEPMFPLRLIFDPDAGPLLRVVGLGKFSGRPFQVVGTLRRFHEEDCMAATSAECHRFIPAGRLGATKDSARQHVSRCRAELAEAYAAVEGQPPDQDILIESKPHKGYRLDPLARFVEE